MSSSDQRWSIALFCAAVVYLTFFYQLGALPFVGADEPRYARIGEEMLLRGEWVTPTLNFIPWLEKPPLLFWAGAASYALFGVSEWAARLPSALLAALALAAVAWFTARQCGDARPAILSVLVLSTSGIYFVFARAATTDMPLTAAFTVAMLAAFETARTGRIRFALAAGAALGLAVLAKGPVALLLMGAVLIACAVLTRSWPFSITGTLAAAAAFAAVALPWFWLVWVENGYNFIATFWINHHLARLITDLHHHSQPFWYFVPVLIAGFFPWLFFLGSAAVRAWHRRRQMSREPYGWELYLWLWAALPFLFFTAGRSKLAGYILPVVPPLAILVAMEWDRWLKGDTTVQRLMRRELLALAGCAAVLAGGLVWVFSQRYHAAGTGTLLVTPLLAGALWALVEFRRRRPLPVFLSLVGGMTLFAALTAWRGAPVVGGYHSARVLAETALPRISEKEPLVLYRYFHHTARYYADYRTLALSLDKPQDLAQYLRTRPQGSYLVLTSRPGWSDLRSRFGARLVARHANLYLAEIEMLR